MRRDDGGQDLAQEKARVVIAVRAEGTERREGQRQRRCGPEGRRRRRPELRTTSSPTVRVRGESVRPKPRNLEENSDLNALRVLQPRWTTSRTASVCGPLPGSGIP
jgi:hypothetical protein